MIIGYRYSLANPSRVSDVRNDRLPRLPAQAPAAFRMPWPYRPMPRLQKAIRDERIPPPGHVSGAGTAARRAGRTRRAEGRASAAPGPQRAIAIKGSGARTQAAPVSRAGVGGRALADR